MKDQFFALLILVSQAFSIRRDAPVRLLIAQIEILRKRVPGNRIVLEPAERKRLLELSVELKGEFEQSLLIVSRKTFKGWLLQKSRGETPKRAGRPSLAMEICELIIRLAKENVAWGTRRILGELKKLKTVASRGSIRRVLKEEGLDPEPKGHGPGPGEMVWQKFLAAHLNTMGACDFLVFTMRGVQIVKTPVAVPQANAFSESWIGGFKRECLNHFVCFSVGHLDHIGQSFARFYNEFRPHQNKGSEPLRLSGQPARDAPSSGAVECKEFLGGLLRHYYRRAA